jgi:pimeloyl-ACP methyl ester carboxylesterase
MIPRGSAQTYTAFAAKFPPFCPVCPPETSTCCAETRDSGPSAGVFLARFVTTESKAERFTVIHYDKLGCGLSDRDGADLSLDGQVAAALAVGARRLRLFGASQGGQVAAAGYQVRTGAGGRRAPPRTSPRSSPPTPPLAAPSSTSSRRSPATTTPSPPWPRRSGSSRRSPDRHGLSRGRDSRPRLSWYHPRGRAAGAGESPQKFRADGAAVQ